jgi:hypothetical protein
MPSHSPRASKRCHSHDKVVATVGSRCQVWNGTAEKTSGGLRIGDLIRTKDGRIRSKAASRAAKKNNTLKKLGYVTKKGEFGVWKDGVKLNRN